MVFRSFYGSSEPGTPRHNDSIPSKPLRPLISRFNHLDDSTGPLDSASPHRLIESVFGNEIRRPAGGPVPLPPGLWLFTAQDHGHFQKPQDVVQSGAFLRPEPPRPRHRAPFAPAVSGGAHARPLPGNPAGARR